jgi:hypothetical protein
MLTVRLSCTHTPAKVQSARETAVWALAIVSCNDEWNVLPQVWEHDGAQLLCDVLHQVRWKSSSRCIQYAATIIQLIIEVNIANKYTDTERLSNVFFSCTMLRSLVVASEVPANKTTTTDNARASSAS